MFQSCEYKVTKVIGDFNCNINLGAGCFKLTFDDNGATTNGMHGKNIYYKYGYGWDSNSSCTNPTLPTIVNPSRTGYKFEA